MNLFQRIFDVFIPVTLTKEQLQDLNYCKDTLLTELKKLVWLVTKLKDKIHKDAPEIMIAVIHLKMFADLLQKKKFKNVEQGWEFMNNLKGIVEKMSYVNNYLKRVAASKQAADANVKMPAKSMETPADSSSDLPITEKVNG